MQKNICSFIKQSGGLHGRVKKEKRNKVLIFSVIILLLVCAGIAIASLHKVNNILLENSPEATIEIIGNSSTTEPAQELRGTVKDVTMNNSNCSR